MNVLQIGPYPPPHGGVQTNLVAIRRYVRERGGRCAVINLTRHRRAEADDVYYPKSGAGVLKLFAELRADIIHFHLGGDVKPRLLALSLACCAWPGSKAVLTFHSGGYPSSEAGRRARAASVGGFVFRRFDSIIAVNEEIVSMFRRMGVAPERLRLIRPHSPSAPPEGAQLSPRLRAFFDAHRPVLTTVGLLETEYDLPLQVEALGRVRERFPRAGLVIVGSGSIEGELRRLVASKPYAEHVMLCGDVPHEETLRAVAESDVFLRTTLYDGDSISVREALHLGVPVVATDNGMRPEGVRLIPVSDGPALVEAVGEQLSLGRRERPANGAAADENVAAVFELYRELLGEGA